MSVATWLQSHPKEIVILACSHFEGINDKLHQAFIFSLRKLFGSKLCPQKVSFLLVRLIYGVKTAQRLTQLTCPPQESALTLRSLWASGYQVILSYDSQMAVRHPQLWPAIPYWWANQRTAQGVINFLDWNKDLGRPGGFRDFGSCVFSAALVCFHEHTKLFCFCFFSQRASSSPA